MNSSCIENLKVDSDTTCKADQKIKNVPVAHVKECLTECEKAGSNLFAFENNTSGVCFEDEKCGCICYAENVTIQTCEMEYKTNYDLHRIADLNEKVCILNFDI